jgi:hypothetical protein
MGESLAELHSTIISRNVTLKKGAYGADDGAGVA